MQPLPITKTAPSPRKQPRGGTLPCDLAAKLRPEILLPALRASVPEDYFANISSIAAPNALPIRLNQIALPM